MNIKYKKEKINHYDSQLRDELMQANGELKFWLDNGENDLTRKITSILKAIDNLGLSRMHKETRFLKFSHIKTEEYKLLGMQYDINNDQTWFVPLDESIYEALMIVLNNNAQEYLIKAKDMIEKLKKLSENN